MYITLIRMDIELMINYPQTDRWRDRDWRSKTPLYSRLPRLRRGIPTTIGRG